MTISITFTANNTRELMEQMLEYWGTNAEPLPAPKPDLSVYPDMVSNANKVANALEKKAARKAKANGVKAPEPEPAPVEVPEEVIREEIADIKGALALKEKIVGQLQAAFKGGKMDAVRAVLYEYGNGAKSFREIGIEDFPAIEAAIQKGALS